MATNVTGNHFITQDHNIYTKIENQQNTYPQTQSDRQHYDHYTLQPNNDTDDQHSSHHYPSDHNSFVPEDSNQSTHSANDPDSIFLKARLKYQNNQVPIPNHIVNKYINAVKKFLNANEQNRLTNYQNIVTADIDVSSPKTSKAIFQLNLQHSQLFIQNFDNLPDFYDKKVSSAQFEDIMDRFMKQLKSIQQNRLKVIKSRNKQKKKELEYNQMDELNVGNKSKKKKPSDGDHHVSLIEQNSRFSANIELMQNQKIERLQKKKELAKQVKYNQLITLLKEEIRKREKQEKDRMQSIQITKKKTNLIKQRSSIAADVVQRQSIVHERQKQIMSDQKEKTIQLHKQITIHEDQVQKNHEQLAQYKQEQIEQCIKLREMKREYVGMLQEQKARMKEKKQMEWMEEYNQEQLRVKNYLLSKGAINHEKSKLNQIKWNEKLKGHELMLQQKGTGLIVDQLEKQTRSVQNIQKLKVERQTNTKNKKIENDNKIEQVKNNKDQIKQLKQQKIDQTITKQKMQFEKMEENLGELEKQQTLKVWINQKKQDIQRLKQEKLKMQAEKKIQEKEEHRKDRRERWDQKEDQMKKQVEYYKLQKDLQLDANDKLEDELKYMIHDEQLDIQKARQIIEDLESQNHGSMLFLKQLNSNSQYY